MILLFFSLAVSEVSRELERQEGGGQEKNLEDLTGTNLSFKTVSDGEGRYLCQ